MYLTLRDSSPLGDGVCMYGVVHMRVGHMRVHACSMDRAWVHCAVGYICMCWLCVHVTRVYMYVCSGV